MESIRDWFEHHLADPQVMGLAVVLLAGFFVVYLTGEMLAPVIASVIIAYLLEGLVAVFQRNGLPRLVAVSLVFLIFTAFMVFVTFALLPLLSRQATQLFQLLPDMLTSGQDALMRLPQLYPQLFSEAQIRDLINSIRVEALSYGQHVVSMSVSSVVSVITIAVYVVLMPLLVFFFLKDKNRIINWFVRFLPQESDEPIDDAVFVLEKKEQQQRHENHIDSDRYNAYYRGTGHGHDVCPQEERC